MFQQLSLHVPNVIFKFILSGLKKKEKKRKTNLTLNIGKQDKFYKTDLKVTKEN